MRGAQLTWLDKNPLNPFHQQRRRIDARNEKHHSSQEGSSSGCRPSARCDPKLILADESTGDLDSNSDIV